MLKLRWYILIGVLTYLFVFLANVPARFVVEQLDGQFAQAGVKLKDVSGTVWDGAGTVSARVNGRPLPPMFVDWDMGLWRVFLAQFALDYKVDGQGFQLSGSGRVSPGSLTLANTQGKVDSSLINRALKQDHRS